MRLDTLLTTTLWATTALAAAKPIIENRDLAPATPATAAMHTPNAAASATPSSRASASASASASGASAQYETSNEGDDDDDYDDDDGGHDDGDYEDYGDDGYGKEDPKGGDDGQGDKDNSDVCIYPSPLPSNFSVSDYSLCMCMWMGANECDLCSRLIS